MCSFIYFVLWLHLNVYRQSWIFVTETWSLGSLHIKCLVLRGGLCQCLALVDLQGRSQDVTKTCHHGTRHLLPHLEDWFYFSARSWWAIKTAHYFENIGTGPGWKGSEFSLMRKWVLREASKQRSLKRADRMGNTKACGRDHEACFFCGVEFDPKDLDKNNWGEFKKEKKTCVWWFSTGSVWETVGLIKEGLQL